MLKQRLGCVDERIGDLALMHEGPIYMFCVFAMETSISVE